MTYGGKGWPDECVTLSLPALSRSGGVGRADGSFVGFVRETLSFRATEQPRSEPIHPKYGRKGQRELKIDLLQ